MLSRTLFRNLSAIVCLSTLCLSTSVVAETKPKNIIMVVADGMGPAYTSAYRYYQDDPSTPEVETTVFDQLITGRASTYPANVSGLVTDSAAGATALAAGIKTYNGAIGVDKDKQPVNTVLREAKRRGLRTGLAVTSQIVHATPASYVTHNESRRNYDAIADRFFDDRIEGQFVADVMLGGGTDYFIREDRDLVAQFIDAGYQYSDDYNKLATYPSGQNVLGLFAPVGLPWALDDRRENRLAFLTKQAIRHLENENGFFLLVEASQVDWAGHANDVASAMAEMHDLAMTMAFLQDYVEENPDTLVVLTADHSTGGLTIGAGGDYRWEPLWLKAMNASAVTVAQQFPLEENPVEYVSETLGFRLNETEAEAIVALVTEEDVRARHKGVTKILDERTNTGWTTSGHTGVDVEVFAMGPGRASFLGHMDNTDIAKKLFALMTNPKQSNMSLSDQTDSSESDGEQENDVCDFKTDWRC
ncbi:alkaline phosphatase [Alteromonas sediminis]|uniref:Alkaline phosphatase n=1 Tax=Alteromonas sediminis TaxID=2259342 RepID=A0A3N5XXW4_9ALTE|nr:alkaline phosphatase [Alteromonas sediminis]RPJ65702.1 alkaline phosphatase [Alteromonas sediminis]